MIATEPEPELGEMFDAAGGARQAPGRAGRRSATTPTATRPCARAHEQFRWFGCGWKVNADLPGPDVVRRRHPVRHARSDVAEQLACGPDVEEHVETIRPFVDAGFTEVALVQIGGDQQEPFLGWAERELLPALRSL